MVFDNFENIAGSNEFLPIFIEAQEGIPLAVGGYFTGEILNGLEDHLKGFLMQVAFLPAATAAAAREMTEDPKAGNILESI